MTSVGPQWHLVSTPHEGSVDVARVPVYPVVRLEMVEHGPEVVGRMDDTVVAEGSRESVQAALVGRAATAAEARPGGAIRARLAGFELGEVGVVTAAGALLPMDDARPSARPRRRFWVLLLVVAVVVGAAAGGLVTVGLRSRSVAPPPSSTATLPGPSPTQMPVLPPAGWASVAQWSLPLSSSSSSASVAVLGGQAFMPGADGSSLVGVEAATGRRDWSAAVGAPLAGGPVIVGRGNDAVVAAWTTDHVTAWSPTTGVKVGEWSLPEGATQVTVAGAGLIVTGQGQHAFVFTGRSLEPRVVPAGSTVVGVTSAEGLVTAGAGRVWLVTSSTVAGEGTAVSGPDGLPWAGVVGIAGDEVLVGYGASAGSAAVIRAFSLDGWSPRWTTTPVATAQYAGSGTVGAPLRVSPSATWGIFGSTLLDLHTGQTRALPADWSTSVVGESLAFGTTNGGVGSVTLAGAVTRRDVSSSAAVPVPPAAVTSDGVALVVAQDGPSAAVYAAPADPGAPAPAPDVVTTGGAP